MRAVSAMGTALFVVCYDECCAAGAAKTVKLKV